MLVTIVESASSRSKPKWLSKSNRQQPQQSNRLQPLQYEAADEGRSIEQEVDSANLSQDVQEALMSIKTDYRSVIVLKHFLGCSYNEISQILEIPEKRVKSRLFSARQQLKDTLTEAGIH